MQHGELQVLRTEIVAPLRHAVRLVDREERKARAGQDIQAARRQEALGSDVQQVEAAVEKAGQLWHDAEVIASKAVPPDKRLPEIRKKILSLKQLGSSPKASSDHTP